MRTKKKHVNQEKTSEFFTEDKEFKIKKLKTKRKEKHRPKNARVHDFNPTDLDDFAGFMDY